MIEPDIRRPESLRPEMLAPCGINCGVCSRVFRRNERCPGCRGDGIRPVYCERCRIKNCDELEPSARVFCFECPRYPCARLKRLDARYRTRYRTNLLDNLERIREVGAERFVESERERWACASCGALTCIHKDACLYCGEPR